MHEAFSLLRVLRDLCPENAVKVLYGHPSEDDRFAYFHALRVSPPGVWDCANAFGLVFILYRPATKSHFYAQHSPPIPISIINLRSKYARFE